ncbi:MAG: hypothetical protein ACRC9L_09010 [Brevinema sp.]
MKYLVNIAFLITGILHATPSDNYIWAKTEWGMLFKTYQSYVKDYAKASASQKQQMDISLAELKPLSSEIPFPELKEPRIAPELYFFRLVDPITGSSSASTQEKIASASKDLGILMAFNAMNGFLITLPDNEKLLIDTQTIMLEWAQKAAMPKTSESDRIMLSEAFSQMVSEIGRQPALLQLAPDYRQRRRFTLITVEAATEEAKRIQEILNRFK